MKPFEPSYMFQTPADSPTGFFIALTAGFALLFLGGAFAYWRRAKLAPNNPVMRRLIRRVAKAAMWLSAIGLFLALMRYFQVPYIYMPIYMYLLLLAMIATVGYFVYDLSERYPLAMWKLQQSHVDRRYRPMAKARPVPQRPRPRARGKQRR